ncbi:MAG: sulfurtransferase [Thiomonas sp. 20-64-5]|nr:MAG: sulfurtransferase [Thiomonas sp. 20-64-5]
MTTPPSTATPAVVNISCYKFVSLDDLTGWQARLAAQCAALQLKGTILLAPEGINLFLAGTRQAIDAVMATLRADPRLADLCPKESLSGVQPFKRMKVKIKREIITLNRPQIRPENGRAPAVTPERLRAWLDAGCDDEGRPMLLLDTRNAFERDLGSFADCIDFRIAKFSEFAPAVEARAADFAGHTVVTFCTGGIRCEKAALLMHGYGIERVYQLEGGILKYFEQVGDAHYEGGCFVFDEREVLGSDLRPSDGTIAPPSAPQHR